MVDEMELVKKSFSFLVLGLFFFAETAVFAQNTSPSSASAGSPQKAVVTSESALIYKDPDFDSTVIKEVQNGEVVSISKRKFGAFNRVRLADGSIGFIADNDYKMKSDSAAKSEKKVEDKHASQLREKAEREEPLDDKSADANDSAKNKMQYKMKSGHKRPFEMQRYRGPQIGLIKYREETMGSTVNEYLTMYGFRWTGPDLIMEGSLQTEWTFLAKIGAPSYYGEATGYSGNGFLILTDVQWLMINPVSTRTFSFFGFGPMARINSYSLELKNGSSTRSYSAQDLVLGTAFALGLAQKFDRFALRGDYKYYWEKQQYWGVGLAVQFEF